MLRLIRGCRLVFIGMAVLAFLIAIPIEHALAALVDTQAFKTDEDPYYFRTRMKDLLAREDVRVALLQHGINPSEAEARIAALTDDEVSQIRDRVAELPEGGMAAIAYPLWLVVLGIAAYILVITGVISLGAYAGTKLKDQAEEEYAKSTPYPAPARDGPLPSVNPNEPWTGKWKVTQGQFTGVYALKQNGNTVISTNDSDYIIDAKVYGAMIWGNFGKRTDTFKATIADDFLSFKGQVNSVYSVEGQRIEIDELNPEPTALRLNPAEPWTGKWKASNGRIPGIWSLTQNGDAVISTSDSDFKLEAKVYGAMIRGKWSTKGVTDRDFQATIAEDGLSFNGAAEYSALRDYFTAKKIE